MRWVLLAVLALTIFGTLAAGCQGSGEAPPPTEENTGNVPPPDSNSVSAQPAKE